MTLTEQEKELIAELHKLFDGRNELRFVGKETGFVFPRGVHEDMLEFIDTDVYKRLEPFLLKAYRTGREDGINEMKDKIANTIVTSDWDNDLDGVINKFSSLSKEDDIKN